MAPRERRGLSHCSTSSLRALPAAVQSKVSMGRIHNLRRQWDGLGGNCDLSGALDRLEKYCFLNGFGEVVVHTSFEAAFAIAFHRMGGQSDDRYVAASRLF